MRPRPARPRRAAWLPRPALAPAGDAAASAAPAQAASAAPRRARQRRLVPYQRLVLAVLLANLGVLAFHLGRGDWRIGDGSALAALSTLTLVNFTAAVLIRQQNVLNLIFGLAGRGRRAWPLWVRWSVSQVHQIGGLHVGGALAGSAWLCAFAAVAAVAPAGVDGTTRGLAFALAALALLVCACAAPAVRMRAHNVFELSHRCGGWTAIGLFWALTLHLGHGPSSWQFWLLALLTASVASPWLRLRRVPIGVERPSAHAAIVRFDHGVTPAVASAVGISRNPLREWHAFATVTTPGRSGFRLLVSRAGDWTSRFIDDPPSHVWVRGTPTAAPMAKVAVLYERVVYVVTGSGIGPCLGQILAARVPAQLVWSTRAPRATYGDALVDEVRAAQPGALIWDTTERGKPDLVQLAHDACREFGAEAVFVVSNKPATERLVAALERRGIPAFGPIWDS